MQFELEVGFKPICAIWQLRGRMRSTQPNTTLHLTACQGQLTFDPDRQQKMTHHGDSI